MIAEINNKISSSGSNLSDRLEDQLTGDFFGTLRYLPFASALQEILGSKYVYPNSVGNCIKSLSYTNEPTYLFWKRLKDTDGSTVEPDLIIEFGDTVICIEVKYNSGLSSDDWESDDEEKEDTNDMSATDEESKNQLARESRAIAKAYGNKKLILLFVAKAGACEEVYCDSLIKIDGNVQLAYLSWSDIYDSISGLVCKSRVEQLVFNDIVRLLERKGFDSFKSINLKEYRDVIIERKAFNFNFEPAPFKFGQIIEIKEDKFYEFR